MSGLVITVLAAALKSAQYFRVSEDDEKAGLDFRYFCGYAYPDMNKMVRAMKEQMERERVVSQKMQSERRKANVKSIYKATPSKGQRKLSRSKVSPSTPTKGSSTSARGSVTSTRGSASSQSQISDRRPSAIRSPRSEHSSLVDEFGTDDKKNSESFNSLGSLMPGCPTEANE